MCDSVLLIRRDWPRTFKGFVFCFLVLFLGQALSVCNPGHPRTHYIDLTGFKPIEIQLTLSPQCWG